MAPLLLERGFSLPARRCAGADLLKRQQRDGTRNRRTAAATHRQPEPGGGRPPASGQDILAGRLRHLDHRVHEPPDEDTLYGLCDLGLGYPELGYVRLSELQGITVRVPPAGSGSIGLERDLYFKPSHSLSVYAEAAWRNGGLTDDPRSLDAAQYHW